MRTRLKRGGWSVRKEQGERHKENRRKNKLKIEDWQ